MIEVKSITKFYGTHKALGGVSFKIDAGEIVGLLGPNGAGKSTTMKIMSGFLIPDEGTVTLDGQDIQNDIISAKEKIGYMPENNPLYKDMLVKDSIEYALKLHKVPVAQRKDRIKYVVNATGLKEVYYRPISELSKGYKQRVGLAQVLVNDPKILILDEPTEGLDPNQRTEIRNLIKKLGQERTVIISTHVMQEVEAMCSRIIIVNKGKVVKDGSKEEVTKNGSHESILLKISSKSNIEAELKKLGDKSKVEELGKSSGLTEYKVTTENHKKLIEDLNKLLKKNDWTLFEIRVEQQNLEDLFRELTHPSAEETLAKAD